MGVLDSAGVNRCNIGTGWERAYQRKIEDEYRVTIVVTSASQDRKERPVSRVFQSADHLGLVLALRAGRWGHAAE